MSTLGTNSSSSFSLNLQNPSQQQQSESSAPQQQTSGFQFSTGSTGTGFSFGSQTTPFSFPSSNPLSTNNVNSVSVSTNSQQPAVSNSNQPSFTQMQPTSGFNMSTTAPNTFAAGANTPAFSFASNAPSATSSSMPFSLGNVASSSVPPSTLETKPAETPSTSTPASSFSFSIPTDKSTQSNFSFDKPAQPLLSNDKPIQTTFTFDKPMQNTLKTEPSLLTGLSQNKDALKPTSTESLSKFTLNPTTNISTKDEKKPSDSTAKESQVFIPSTIKNKNLLEIFSKFSIDLETQLRSFKSQAILLAENDMKLILNANEITLLITRVNELDSLSKEISQQLLFIKSQQLELEGVLQILEEGIPFLEESCKSPLSSNTPYGGNELSFSDQTRSELFKTALSIGRELTETEQFLSSFKTTQRKANVTESNTSLSSIISVLSGHANTLDLLSSSLNELEVKMNEAAKKVSQIETSYSKIST